MTSDNRMHGLGLVLGAFVLGAAAGATIALLTAPRSGRETRERLKKRASELKTTMEHVPEKIQRAASRAVKAGQAAFDNARDEAS